MIHQIAATLLLMIVFGTLYGALRDRYPKGSLVFKASATCMAVWNCGSGLAAGKQGFSDWMIFVGLLFCVLAGCAFRIGIFMGSRYIWYCTFLFYCRNLQDRRDSNWQYSGNTWNIRRVSYDFS